MKCSRRSFAVASAIALFSASPVSAGDQALAELLRDLKLVNYYPAGHAQTKMWDDWDPQQIDHDFAEIERLHANAVRVAVYTSAFGFPEPRPEMLERLEQFLTLAATHHIRVKLALFGFFDQFSDIEGSTRWLNAVLKGRKDDRRICFLDLFNELKLEKPGAMEWAREMLPRLRAAAGSIPIAMSVSGSAGLPGLVTLRSGLAPGAKETGAVPDLYELHYYSSPTLAFRTFTAAKSAVAPLPLFIGEFGYSTQPHSRSKEIYGELWWEAFQAQYYRTIQHAASRAGLSPPAPWIFSDFTTEAFPPKDKAVDPGEFAMGFVRADGKQKRAAAAVAECFREGAVDLSFNNSFEEADENGLALNWLLWKPELAELARDTTVAHSGMASVRITRSKLDRSATPAFKASPVVPVETGARYRAGVWARGRGVTGHARLALGWFDANYKFIKNDFSREVPAGGTEWQQLVVVATPPDNAASVEIHLGSSADAGTVWFDDVSFARE